MNECSEVLNTLIDTTITFKRALDEAMKEKGILSFSDCEHLALDVMVRLTDSGYEIFVYGRKIVLKHDKVTIN